MTPILGTITPALSNLLQRLDNRVVKQRNKQEMQDGLHFNFCC